MKIELTDENMKQVQASNDYITINGEKWEFVEETDYEYDEKWRSKQIYYKQPSTGKYFLISLFYSISGHENYEFYLWEQDKTAYEVEKVIVQREEWRIVE